MTTRIRRLIIDAALNAAITFVIARAFDILREDVDAMKKRFDEEESKEDEEAS